MKTAWWFKFRARK